MAVQDQLIEILKQEDEEKASLAMKALLELPNVSDIIARHEDTDNPLLRRRIQQLASIFNRLCLGATLENVIRNNEHTAWDVFCQINVILDRQTSLVQINDLMMSVVCYDRFRCRTTEQFVDFMKETGVLVDHTEERYLTAFLPSDVLFSRIGSSLVVTALAQQAARLHNYRTTIGCYQDEICLRDSSFNVILPGRDWTIVHPVVGEFEELDKRNLAVRLLSNIFTSSILEQLHTITFTSSSLLSRVLGASG
ncbi:MAG: hypothetical protein IJJ26_08980 [Victivallales bacterium]|nr:hypothetical protein [Victivallales bacterium]